MHDTDSRKRIEERLARVDALIKERKIPFSSKVIPVNKALESRQWIMPTSQAIEILRNSRIFVLTDCECRTLFKRCHNPVNVCFLVNDAAESALDRGEGRQVSLDEARDVLEKANDHGLVHLTIYNPEQFIFALCSCCSCCCHDLQILKRYHRMDFIARSDYFPVTDHDLCTGCGTCVERCVFEARTLREDRLTLVEEQCYGCGLCVTRCPEEAITMELADR